MWIDLPPVSSTDIQTELNKPLSQEVVSIRSCENPDFQKQFQLLQSQTKNETLKLHNEITFTEKQKEVLRKIYQNLWKNNPELKQAIENQTIKIFEVPNRDLVALSVEGKNVDYLYDLDGKIYWNFKEWRKILDDYIRLLGFSSSWNFREKLLLNWENYNLNDWNYDSNKITFILLWVNWEELEQFSNNSLKRYSEWADHLKTLNKRLDEILSEWQEEKE